MSKCPSKACICAVLTVWTFIGVIALIVSIVVYLVPFVKVVRYRQSTCQVESSFFTTQYVCPCDGHGHQCPLYPCFLVAVSLNFTDGSLWVVTLYVDDDQQASVLDVSVDQQERCTLKVCGPKELSNREAVEDFKRAYGNTGQFVPCYYDPWDIRSGAVLKATIPGWEVFHSVFWPALCVAAGLTACAIFCRRCRRLAAESENCSSSQLDDKAGVDLNNSGSATFNRFLSPAASTSASSSLNVKKKRKHRSLRNLWMIQQSV